MKITNIATIVCLPIILNLNVIHALLHVGNENTRALKEGFPRNEEIVPYSIHIFSKEKSKSIILPTALIYIYQAGELFTVRALLDAGFKGVFFPQKFSCNYQFLWKHIMPGFLV